MIRTLNRLRVRNGGSRPGARGFITMDVMIGTALIVLMATLFAIAVRQYAAARYENDLRQTLRFAAETELHRLRAGIIDVPAVGTTDERRAGGITLRVSCEAARGTWDGFALVQVEAAQPNKRGRSSRVRLAAYLPRTAETDAVPEGDR